MKKTFFIVPGFNQKASSSGYSWLVTLLEQKGFGVIKVPVKWKYRTMSDYINDFIDVYNKNKTEVNYVLGFSYGAVITLASANKLKPAKIFLCSLSSDFSEDLPTMKPWIKKYIGKNRLLDAEKRSGIKLAKELKVPSVVFYGEKEGKLYPQLKIRCEETTRLAKNSKLVVIPKAPHDISNPEYKEALKHELKLQSL